VKKNKVKRKNPKQTGVVKIKKDGSISHQGEGGGKRPFYKTDKQLRNKIDEYFAGGYRKRTVFIGRDSIPMEIPDITISDLVIFLGFCDRSSFYALEKIEKFRHTIKRARTFIEREYESLLKGNNVTGAIFALKNFGWTDTQEVKNTGEITLKFEGWKK